MKKSNSKGRKRHLLSGLRSNGQNIRQRQLSNVKRNQSRGIMTKDLGLHKPNRISKWPNQLESFRNPRLLHGYKQASSRQARRLKTHSRIRSQHLTSALQRPSWLQKSQNKKFPLKMNQKCQRNRKEMTGLRLQKRTLFCSSTWIWVRGSPLGSLSTRGTRQSKWLKRLETSTISMTRREPNFLKFLTAN